MCSALYKSCLTDVMPPMSSNCPRNQLSPRSRLPKKISFHVFVSPSTTIQVYTRDPCSVSPHAPDFVACAPE
ncbi:unnamed protein product [Sympodiomycopsis kandeliae]